MFDDYTKRLLDIQDNELEYIYENDKGELVLKNVMEIYNDCYFNAIFDKITKWGNNYEDFKDTSLFERYILNYSQFSAAKTYEECKTLQAMVFKDGKKQAFNKFRDAANEYKEQISQTWLRVEYDNAGRGAVMADKWIKFEEDKDLYPYWQYETRHDNRVRHEHRELDGKVFRIGDVYGDRIFPPSDWNCRCTGRNTDTGKPVTEEEAKHLLNTEVDEQFRYNPAHQGMFPKKDCPYFEDFNKARNVSYSQLTALKAEKPRLEKIANAMHEWLHGKNKILFRNDKLKLVVYLPNSLMQEIQRFAPVNYGLIKKCVENPSEVWAKWKDKEQVNSTYQYILYGKPNLVVTVEKGVIIKAQDVVNSKLGQYQKTIPILFKK
jgi:SPP1 gp7 family putative phage head morphogenesis protein